MKQESEQVTQDVHNETYEAPRIEVIKLELEQPILQASSWPPPNKF